MARWRAAEQHYDQELKELGVERLSPLLLSTPKYEQFRKAWKRLEIELAEIRTFPLRRKSTVKRATSGRPDARSHERHEQMRRECPSLELECREPFRRSMPIQTERAYRQNGGFANTFSPPRNAPFRSENHTAFCISKWVVHASRCTRRHRGDQEPRGAAAPAGADGTFTCMALNRKSVSANDLRGPCVRPL